MSSRNDDGDPRDRPADDDILGGPDRAEREDVLSPPGQEPVPGNDILGGPDPDGREDEFTDPARPATPAPQDILGGPDTADTEDIMGPDHES